MTDASEPEVSVVMPVYCCTEAHEQYLFEALESVAAQTLRSFEVVIVDDASPLDITHVIRSVSNLPDTKIIRTDTNAGHAAARNRGVEAASGSLIAFLDHDDIWLPEKLELQTGLMRQESEVAMVFCDVEILGHHRPGLYMDQSAVPVRPGLAWMLSHNNPVITVSAAVARKQALLDIGLFDTRYSSCDDFDAWIKLRRRAPVVRIPQKLAVYRLHEYNLNYSVDRLKDNRLLTALILECLRDLSFREKIQVLPKLVKKLIGRAVLRIAAGPGRLGRSNTISTTL